MNVRLNCSQRNACPSRELVEPQAIQSSMGRWANLGIIITATLAAESVKLDVSIQYITSQ